MTQTPKHKFKSGDPVMLPSGIVAELTSVQYVHNRYQLYDVSGWQYGIENLQPADWKTEALKWREEALRQYPTPEAYEAACAALEKHRARADAAEKALGLMEGERDQYKMWQLDEEKRANDAESREQRLKEAVEAIKELSKWDGISQYLDRCYIEARDVLATLYPDTPAPADPNAVLEQNGIDPTGWTWHTPAPKEADNEN